MNIDIARQRIKEFNKQPFDASHLMAAEYNAPDVYRALRHLESTGEIRFCGYDKKKFHSRKIFQEVKIILESDFVLDFKPWQSPWGKVWPSLVVPPSLNGTPRVFREAV